MRSLQPSQPLAPEIVFPWMRYRDSHYVEEVPAPKPHTYCPVSFCINILNKFYDLCDLPSKIRFSVSKTPYDNNSHKVIFHKPGHQLKNGRIINWYSIEFLESTYTPVITSPNTMTDVWFIQAREFLDGDNSGYLTLEYER